MAMESPPWDQRIARILVKPLINSPITPNQITIFTMILGLAGAGLIATGDKININWGAGLFVLARFLDHFDGELARQKGMSSKLGYYLDYIAGASSYFALFICIGIGLRDSSLGDWALVLGIAGTVSAIICTFLDLEIDKVHGGDVSGAAVRTPSYAGFELEDGIYLIAPIAWFGFLTPFLVAAGIGATVYCLWRFLTLWRLRRSFAADQHHDKNQGD